MFFLLLTILSSVSVSVVLKISESRGGNRMVVAGANYVVATLMAYIMMAEASALRIGAGWAALGLAAGVGFVAGFIFLMRGLKEIGLAIPTSAARLSMLIPVTGSIIVFDEQPSATQIVGIISGVVAFILLGAAQRRGRADLDFGAIGILVAIFATVGITDFSMKIAKANDIESVTLAFYIFLSASITCWLWVLVRRIRIKQGDLLLGALLGIPNYFSVYFLLKALDRLAASIVFPVVSAGAVVLVTIVAMLFWKERPNRIAWLGILLAAIAVALLGLQQGT